MLLQGSTTAAVDETDVVGVIDVVTVVEQLPSNISSSFVAAPVMQVPSSLPVLSILLQPQSPMQSLPHVMLMHGSTSVVVTVDVVVVGGAGRQRPHITGQAAFRTKEKGWPGTQFAFSKDTQKGPSSA